MRLPFVHKLFAGTLALPFCLAGCGQEAVTSSPAKPVEKLEPTKKVEVSITSMIPRSSFSLGTSFQAKPDSPADVTVLWNGHQFQAKTDSGETFLNFGPSASFQNRKEAGFVLKKKVTVTRDNGSVTMNSSQDVTVKLGVPAKW